MIFTDARWLGHSPDRHHHAPAGRAQRFVCRGLAVAAAVLGLQILPSLALCQTGDSTGDPSSSTATSNASSPEVQVRSRGVRAKVPPADLDDLAAWLDYK